MAFEKIYHKADLCIVGGGLSGTIAALSAARKGVKVVLVQDRPVLGGNSSSEIRMWVRGAKGFGNKETGILAEFEEENIYRNATLSHSVWDSVLFGKVKENKNITLLLNASCLDAVCENQTVKSVTAWQMTTYTYHEIEAEYFADCSGDSVLAFLTGAEYRIGREGRSEFHETIGPEKADNKTMGMSILLQAKETDHKVEFIPPEWANVYESDEDFAVVTASQEKCATFRDHKIGTSGGNLWWMELGGDTEPIVNAEETRDELIKVVFGIWDHIKNRGDHGYDNWELEWVGFLPGKRESTRYIGDHILTQNDIEQNRKFEDAIAYGGWPMDDHNPKGMKANGADEVPSLLHPAPSPYQIPYRCIYSKNIKNLFFAGRNISATHAAMSSTRVMGTCSLLGQALGNAVAICLKNHIMPRDILNGYITELQQEVSNDGIFIPDVPRVIGDVNKQAQMSICELDKEILFDGIERPREDEGRHHIVLNKGDSIVFSFDEKKELDTLRVQFDLDYERKSISPNYKMRVFAMKLNQGLDFVPVKVANTIVKEFEVYADGQLVFQTNNNYYSLVKIPLDIVAQKIEIKFKETWGHENIHLFACDFI